MAAGWPCCLAVPCCRVAGRTDSVMIIASRTGAPPRPAPTGILQILEATPFGGAGLGGESESVTHSSPRAGRGGPPGSPSGRAWLTRARRARRAWRSAEATPIRRIADDTGRHASRGVPPHWYAMPARAERGTKLTWGPVSSKSRNAIHCYGAAMAGRGLSSRPGHFGGHAAAKLGWRPSSRRFRSARGLTRCARWRHRPVGRASGGVATPCLALPRHGSQQAGPQWNRAEQSQ